MGVLTIGGAEWGAPKLFWDPPFISAVYGPASTKSRVCVGRAVYYLALDSWVTRMLGDPKKKFGMGATFLFRFWGFRAPAHFSETGNDGLLNSGGHDGG